MTCFFCGKYVFVCLFTYEAFVLIPIFAFDHQLSDGCIRFVCGPSVRGQCNFARYFFGALVALYVAFRFRTHFRFFDSFFDSTLEVCVCVKLFDVLFVALSQRHPHFPIHFNHPIIVQIHSFCGKIVDFEQICNVLFHFGFFIASLFFVFVCLLGSR